MAAAVGRTNAGLSPGITWHGASRKDDVKALLPRADLFVAGSNDWRQMATAIWLPNVLMEAQAVGCGMHFNSCFGDPRNSLKTEDRAAVPPGDVGRPGLHHGAPWLPSRYPAL